MTDLLRDLQSGKLSQTCPGCGRVEAAHFYCSGCYRQTGPADWYRETRRVGASEAQGAPEADADVAESVQPTFAL